MFPCLARFLFDGLVTDLHKIGLGFGHGIVLFVIDVLSPPGIPRKYTSSLLFWHRLRTQKDEESSRLALA
jgi:hypothetical protein